MVSKVLISIIAVVSLLMSGCAAYYVSPVQPPMGFWYNSQGIPVDLSYENGSQAMGNRVGSSKAESVLGLVSWGDSSVQGAARAGGITQVNQIDADFFNILGIYSSYETTVTGQ